MTTPSPTTYIPWLRHHLGRRKVYLVYATMIVRDAQQRILLQRRVDFNWWGIPGGALELNEDIQQCAHRELAEETSLTVADWDWVGLYTDPKFEVTYPNGDQVQQFTVCLSGQVTGGQMLPDGLETTHQQFFTPQELPWQHIPYWYRCMLQDALAGGGPHFLPAARQTQLQDQMAQVRPHIGQARYIGPGATAVIVHPENGRLLRIQRQDDNHWTFPAGFCHLGENVAHTAVREVKEETGLDIQPERLLGLVSSPHFHWTYPNGDQVKNVSAIFRARLVGGTPTIDPAAGRQMAWVEPDKILSMNRDSRYQPLYEAVLTQLDKGWFLL